MHRLLERARRAAHIARETDRDMLDPGSISSAKPMIAASNRAIAFHDAQPPRSRAASADEKRRAGHTLALRLRIHKDGGLRVLNRLANALHEE